jgi:transcriptional regulator with XRE-family HTH domain
MTGTELKAERKLWGWTQQDVMDASGLSRNVISDFETGYRLLRSREADRLAAGLHKLRQEKFPMLRNSMKQREGVRV